MKKNDVFAFTALNGVKVTAVVLTILQVYKTDEGKTFMCEYLCYAQNRLFEVSFHYGEVDGETKEWGFCIDSIIVDHAILPDYDELLEAEQQKFEGNYYEALSSIGNVEF